MVLPPVGPLSHGLATDTSVSHCVQGHGIRDVVRNVELMDPIIDIVNKRLVVDVP